jgi:hypothetical protein
VSKKNRIKVNFAGVMKYLLGEPPKPKLSRRQRREIERQKREREHREGFIDYLGWLLRQPPKQSKY